MIQMLKRLAGIAALVGVCFLVVSCGGGSTSQPSQGGQSGVNVATGSHVLGDASAKVTIIEFADFQCPYCKNFYTDTESQIVTNYVNTGKAKFAFRQFPLSMHQNAQIAAEASECAAKIGGNDAFWKYHDLLFTVGQGDGTGLDATSLKSYAAQLQLDTAIFNTCLDNHQTAPTVSQDITDGTAAGVTGTPSFFINGKLLVGAQPYSTFQAAIDAAQ
jgi:protein-disulfide isomerase